MHPLALLDITAVQELFVIKHFIYCLISLYSTQCFPTFPRITLGNPPRTCLDLLNADIDICESGESNNNIAIGVFLVDMK